MNANSYEIIGYGSGESLEAAKSNALADIAAVLKTDVRSEFAQRTRAGGDEYEQFSASSISVSSDIVLSGVEIVRSEQIDNKFFVAARLDNRSFEVRLSEKIGKPICAEKRGFLALSPLGQSVKSLLGCAVDLRVYRQNSLTMIGTPQASLVWSETQFTRLYPEVFNTQIIISPSKQNLKDNESFSLTLKSEQNGFVTLFNLYDSGQVALIAANLPIKANINIKIPQAIDPELELVASTNGKQNAQDFFVAVWSKNRILTSRFTQASDQPLGDQLFNLDDLITLLDQHIWSSTAINIAR